MYITERDIVWNEEEENPPESESPSKKKKKGASKKEEEQKLYPHHKYSFPACGFTQRSLLDSVFNDPDMLPGEHLSISCFSNVNNFKTSNQLD